MDNASVNTAIAEDPAAVRGAAELGTAATLDIQNYDQKKPLDLPSHDGSITTTHPSLLDAGEAGWNGYRYWMSHTPWPSGGREVPNIIASNNLIDWEVPPGLTNPIATHLTVNAATGSTYSYLADPDIILDEDNWMRCYYRGSTGGSEGIIMQKSQDGVTWTAPVVLMHSGSTVEQWVSPSVVWDGTTYYMYVVDRVTGGLAENQKIRRFSSADGVTFGSLTTCEFTAGGLLAPWHIDVVKAAGYYHVLVATHGGVIPPSTLLYYKSSDGINFSGDPYIPAINWSGGSYDAVSYYRSSLIPADSGATRWHLVVSGLPESGSSDGVTGNPWRIGLRTNVDLEYKNSRNDNEFGLASPRCHLRWKSGSGISSGTSVDVCKPSTLFVESFMGVVGKTEIFGIQGTTQIGGTWVSGSYSATQISSSMTTTTVMCGAATPFLSVSALHDNVTPVSGDTITGVTSGATAKFHKMRNISPAQMSLRSFTGTAQFTVGEQIQCNGVTLTNVGTPVTISAKNYFPAANALNFMMIDSVSGYPGRLQAYNSFGATVYATINFDSCR